MEARWPAVADHFRFLLDGRRTYAAVIFCWEWPRCVCVCVLCFYYNCSGATCAVRGKDLSYNNVMYKWIWGLFEGFLFYLELNPLLNLPIYVVRGKTMFQAVILQLA